MTFFQASCGIFRHLKDIVLSHVQNEPTPDMQPDTLGALASLMLAQAQDCICRKAITGETSIFYFTEEVNPIFAILQQFKFSAI